MKTIEENYDVIVCGGGLAGYCAAVGAARQGAKTCLIHDRPVFGGCASTEVRVTVHGAGQHHCYTREGGIMGELLTEERALNHEQPMENGWINSVWDRVLLDFVQREPNLTYYLNTPLCGVRMEDESSDRFEAEEPNTDRGFYHRPSRYPQGGGRIACIIARILQAETELRLCGRVYIDATGDGVLADLAGCEWRMGCEAQEEFGEWHAPEKASTDTMGNSLQFHCRDIGRPAPYTAPAWAVDYRDRSFFWDQGRAPDNPRGGYWWIELGSPDHTIHDNEKLRADLTAHLLGVWDYMKNRDPDTMKACAHYALDWFGQVPGKRESRRIVGEVLLTENDIQEKKEYDDEIAFGGWFLDLHTTGGLLADTSEPSAAAGYGCNNEYEVMSSVGPYGIPLGMAIPRGVDNLMTAGRCMSMTRCAMGTVRVMGALALTGEACGIAAALAAARGLTPSQVRARHIRDVQTRLLQQGHFLLHADPVLPGDLARDARIAVSSEMKQSGAVPGAEPDHPWERKHIRMDDRDRAVVLPVGSEPAESLTLFLSNRTDQPIETMLSIESVDSIWDYDRHEPLYEAPLTVPPGTGQVIEHALPGGPAIPPDGMIRITVQQAEGLEWPMTEVAVPAWVSQYGMNDKKMACNQSRKTHALLVSPAQDVYGAINLRRGATRPYRHANCWISDPDDQAPWLTLAWNEPVELKNIQWSFAGHMRDEYHRYPPFCRDPDTVADFDLEAEAADGTWRVLHEVRDNYHRVVHIELPEPVKTRKLRARFLRTHGRSYVTVYGVQVY